MNKSVKPLSVEDGTTQLKHEEFATCRNCRLAIRWVFQGKPRGKEPIYGWQHIHADGRLTPRWCYPFSEKGSAEDQMFAESEEIREH